MESEQKILRKRVARIIPFGYKESEKENYIEYYELVIEKVKKGGLIIADNVLWSGKILSLNEQDKETQALRTFNQKVQEDNRVENILLPIRDGLMLCRKLLH